MENLFNPVHSALFQAAGHIINELHAGKIYTRQNIINELVRALPNKDVGVNFPETAAIAQSLFLFNEQGQAGPYLDRTFPFIISGNELSWLKSMLLSKESSFLLSPKLKDRLLAELKDIPEYIPADAILAKRGSAQEAELPPLLRTVWLALCTGKKLHYANRDLSGHLHKGTISPCRLEYDISADIYRLICWHDEEQRAIKMNVNSLESAATAEEPADPQRNDKLRAFLDTRKTVAVVKILPKNNAVERTFIIFSPYDKTGRLDPDGTYTLNITYYDFDKPEIINKILSLGSAIIVSEPDGLKQEIVSRLKAAWTYYADNSVTDPIDQQ